jgi:hypothetical protein
MIKRYSLSICLILIIAFTQNRAFSQSLPGDSFDSAEKSAGNEGQFYGGAALKMFEKNDYWGLDFGFLVSYQVTGSFAFGFGFYTLITHNIQLDFGQSPGIYPFLRLTYGGFELFYTNEIVDDLFINVGGLLGAGVGNSSQSTQIDVTTSPSGEWLMIAEPAVKLGYEVFGGVVTELSAGYRLTTNLDMPGLENNNINCPVFGLTLKLSNVSL